MRLKRLLLQTKASETAIRGTSVCAFNGRSFNGPEAKLQPVPPGCSWNCGNRNRFAIFACSPVISVITLVAGDATLS
jgi:hypothetical protein